MYDVSFGLTGPNNIKHGREAYFPLQTKMAAKSLSFYWVTRIQGNIQFSVYWNHNKVIIFYWEISIQSLKHPPTHSQWTKLFTKSATIRYYSLLFMQKGRAGASSPTKLLMNWSLVVSIHGIDIIKKMLAYLTSYPKKT